MDYKDETRDGVEVDFDGNTFENCKFNDYPIQIFGNGDIDMKNCSI